MNKGLEYIRDISCLISENYNDKEPLTEEQKLSKNCFLDYCKYIEKELQRLEEIDNAETSKALECWQWINATIPQWVREKDKEHPNVLEPIKQYILKAQEQEKVLKIIFEKGVNIVILTFAKTYKEYNDRLLRLDPTLPTEVYFLTKEEFDLVKR